MPNVLTRRHSSRGSNERYRTRAQDKACPAICGKWRQAPSAEVTDAPAAAPSEPLNATQVRRANPGGGGGARPVRRHLQCGRKVDIHWHGHLHADRGWARGGACWGGVSMAARSQARGTGAGKASAPPTAGGCGRCGQPKQAHTTAARVATHRRGAPAATAAEAASRGAPRPCAAQYRRWRSRACVESVRAHGERRCSLRLAPPYSAQRGVHASGDKRCAEIDETTLTSSETLPSEA